MIWHFLKHGTFSHDLHRGRDKDGKAVHVCTLCGVEQPIFAEPVIIGPAHVQKPDVGASQAKAIYPDRKPVIGWRQSQR